MFKGRRLVTTIMSGVLLWFVAVVGLAIVRPQSDTMPVGTDHTLSPPKLAIMTFSCNSAFSGSARSSEPLPALKAQPTGVAPLKIPRPPCELVHSQARKVLAIDLLVLLGTLGAGAYVLSRKMPRVATADTAGLTTA